jgi:flagellar biosynthesis protein FlhB
VKNTTHNSSNDTSNNEVFTIIINYSGWIIKIVLKLVVKLLSLIFASFLNLLTQTTNKIKPHFYRFEELLYSRAKDLFGI